MSLHASRVARVRWIRGLLLGGALAIASACRAEPAGLTFEPAAMPLACLNPAQDDGTPQYPPSQLATGGKAVVRVEMTFSASNAPPQVRTLSNSGDPAFEAAVVSHVARYRLPCLAQGRSVTATQTFDFSAGGPTVAFEPGYALEKLAKMGCTVEGLGAPLEYPRGTTGREPPDPGNVIVMVTFNAADEQPVVAVLFDGGDSRLASRVRSVVENYRLRCQAPLTEPVVATQSFDFLREDRPHFQLASAVTLTQLLGKTTNWDKRKVRFDLTAMGCPFDVEFKPYQPFMNNSVRMDVPSHPERREFGRWLEQLFVDIPPRAMRTAIGSASTVTVPCGVVDLT